MQLFSQMTSRHISSGLLVAAVLSSLISPLQAQQPTHLDTNLKQTQLSQTQLGQTQLGQAQLSQVQLSQVQLSQAESGQQPHCANWPLVIAHRGDSGHGPEHTASAYWRAMEQGADFIEIDLVLSKDGVLISRHENELSASTNVAELEQFASRKTSKMIDGVKVTGWFSEDFTLAELRLLKARESKPEVRPANTKLNDQEGLLTLSEILQLVQRFEMQSGRAVGVYIETKHPSFFQQQFASQTTSTQFISEKLLQQLAAWQQLNQQAVYIQSFEISNLRWLRAEGLTKYHVKAKLIQLIGDISADNIKNDIAFAVPGDMQQAEQLAISQYNMPLQQLPAGWQQTGFVLHYGQLVTPQGLQFVASYADGIGPWKDQWFAGGQAVVGKEQLTKQGLLLHPYTFRAERNFVPAAYHSLQQELAMVFTLGVDGLFTDFPAQVLTFRQQVCQRQ